MSRSTGGSGRGNRALRRVFFAFAFAGGGVALAAGAREVVVQVQEVYIQPRRSGLGRPVATARMNERLTVLAPAQNGWLQVRTQQGQEGYVKEGSLTKLAFSTGGTAVSGDATSSGLRASLAGKGLERAAQEFASRNGVNTAAVNRMLGLSNTISPDAMDQWQKAGAVGPYKGN